MKESNRKAIKKYREKVKRIPLDFYPTELDLFEHVEKQPKKQTYIKNLIREDMKKGDVYVITIDSSDGYHEDSQVIGYMIGTEKEAISLCIDLDQRNKALPLKERYVGEFLYQRVENITK